VDKGEQLGCVADASMDTVFCLGALEHMLDKSAVCRSVFRVLKPGGRFICLTPDGHYIRVGNPMCFLRENVETLHHPDILVVEDVTMHHKAPDGHRVKKTLTRAGCMRRVVYQTRRGIA